HFSEMRFSISLVLFIDVPISRDEMISFLPGGSIVHRVGIWSVTSVTNSPLWACGFWRPNAGTFPVVDTVGAGLTAERLGRRHYTRSGPRRLQFLQMGKGIIRASRFSRRNITPIYSFRHVGRKRYM